MEKDGTSENWYDGGSIRYYETNPEVIDSWKKLRSGEYWKEQMTRKNANDEEPLGNSVNDSGGDNNSNCDSFEHDGGEEIGGSIMLRGAGEEPASSEVITDEVNGSGSHEGRKQGHSLAANTVGVEVQNMAILNTNVVSLEEFNALKETVARLNEDLDAYKKRVEVQTLARFNEDLDAYKKRVEVLENLLNLKNGGVPGGETGLGKMPLPIENGSSESVTAQSKKSPDATPTQNGKRRRRCPVRGIPSCQECNMEFKTASSKCIHMQRIHEGKKWICEYCDKTFNSPSLKSVHRKKDHLDVHRSLVKAKGNARQKLPSKRRR